MANVTASVTLQYSPGSGNYPSSGAGYAAVSAYSGDNIVITLSPFVAYGVYSPNTGELPSGNHFLTSNTATSINSSLSTFSGINSQTITISGITQSGAVSFWCDPAVSGNAVPYRARVYVTVLTPSASISVNGSLNRSPLDTATVTWARTPSGTYYFNSIGTSAVPRALPRSGTLTGTGGSFDITYQAFQTGVTASSRTIKYYLRETNTGGNNLATYPSNPSQYIRIYRVPDAPTELDFTVTSSSITADAGGGQYGILQVSIDNNNWYTDGYTFSGLNASTTYTIYARRYNVVTPSSVYTETVTTSASQATASAPTMNPFVTLGDGGFYINANPGTSTGTVNYVFTSGGASVDPPQPGQTSQFIGLVGAATWEGSTWTITATATEGSTTDTSTATITLPNITMSPESTSVQQGSNITITITATNFSGTQTMYYRTSGAFTTSNTAVSVSQGDTDFTIAVPSNASTGTLNVVLDVSTFGTAEDTVATLQNISVTQAPASATAPNAPSLTDNDADSAYVTVTATATGGSGGTLQYGRTNVSATTVPTTWQNHTTFSHARGTTWWYWARRSATAVSASPGTARTPGFKSTNPIANENNLTLAIGTLSPTSPLATSYASNVTIPYSGGSNGDQYRLYSNDASPQWLETAGPNEASGSFVLLHNSSAQSTGSELPAEGESWTYEVQGRRATAGGAPTQAADANWVALTNTPDIIISRGAVVSYSISAPSSVTEGNNLTFNISTSGGTPPNGTTVPYNITGISSFDLSSGSLSGDITINNSAGSLTLGIASDNQDDAETLVITLGGTNQQDSAGNAVSTTASVSITDPAASADGGENLSGGSGIYGLEVTNSNQTVVIDPSSRIINVLATDTFTVSANSISSKQMFTAFDCRNASEIGIMVFWSNQDYPWGTPFIERNSNGQGITVTKPSLYGGSANVGGMATYLLIRY